MPWTSTDPLTRSRLGDEPPTDATRPRLFDGDCLVHSRRVGEPATRGAGGDGDVADDLQTRVTQILRDFAHGDAKSELLPLVYEQLRKIAQRRMAGERRGHTLEATALVHEAYMRLIGNTEIEWESRAHFYGAAAEAMRRILIDHARKRDSKKRGGGVAPTPISVIDLAENCDAEQVVAIDDAITKLEGEDARAAQVVRYRFFAGLSVEETAEVLGVSERTVMREWSFARARLFQLLDPEAG